MPTRRRAHWRRSALYALLFLAGWQANTIHSVGFDSWRADKEASLQQAWTRVSNIRPEAATAQIQRTLVGISDLRPAALVPRGESGYKVTRVIDGDTVEIHDGHQTIKVRLHGIDTPERDQPYGSAATRALSTMVGGKPVRVSRVVAKLYVDDTYVNKALVEQGYAWWYERYARDEWSLSQAQRSAREAERGLWAGANPIPPWSWRRGQR